MMALWDSDDMALVSKAITRQRLCVSCIIAVSGVTRARVEAILSMIGATLVIRTVAACEKCGSERAVFGFSEPWAPC